MMQVDEEVKEAVVEEPMVIDTLMELRQWVFEFTSDLCPDKAAIAAKISAKIEENSMAPYYEQLLENIPSFTRDNTLLGKMKEKNEADLKALNERKADAEENLGEQDVLEAKHAILRHYQTIGDKVNCLQEIEALAKETKGMGPQLELIFHRIRLGFEFADPELVKDNIPKAHEILKKEGDWEKRNRLKVYEGLQHITVRDFKKAAELFLESVATFSCYELMDYKEFIFYTVFVAIPTLSRPELKTKVMENSEVLSVLHELEIESLVNSIYQCQYPKVFQSLHTVCEKMLRTVWLAPHTNFYYREIRVLAFSQFLASYRSVTLQNMADAFRITPEVLDAQLCTFIAAKRLTCTIDKVSGQVVTARSDAKNANYHQLLKTGDLLLNKVTKLARIVGT